MGLKIIEGRLVITHSDGRRDDGGAVAVAVALTQPPRREELSRRAGPPVPPAVGELPRREDV